MLDVGQLQPVDPQWATGEALALAPRLLGMLIRCGECVGRINEVEAYHQFDPASHSYRGPTLRNRSMFLKGGHWYVYLSYGIHHCLNLVTGPEGDGQAILIRGVHPELGMDTMRARRGVQIPEHRLVDGPGKLCAAFAIDRSFDGLGMDLEGLSLWTDGYQPKRVLQSPRIGISKAVDYPWRYRIPTESPAGGRRK
jgi:DNA-3-methyladenine glycosylase